MSQNIQNNVGIIIVSAGRGERAGRSNGPKQYSSLGQKSVIGATLSCFSEFIAPKNTCIVIHADDEALFKQATKDIDTSRFQIAIGGNTRQVSVLNGLKKLADEAPELSHVMIHDAARPFVSEALIFRLLEEASAFADDGILPTLAVSETLKTVYEGVVTGTASRKDMHRAQTPQMFPLNDILSIHEKAADEKLTSFTDDSSLFEWADRTMRIVEGDPDNIKLTYPQDFPKEDKTMQAELPDIRTGNGYDVHVFGNGDKVVLCGIDIPFEKSLSGHSDADVGLHALTDALLATCGAGDIGDHFPPSDEKWRGVASHIFLTKAAQIVRDHGGTIMNADVTIVAEAPKIAPHRTAMRENLSALLNISLDRCSVKATTNEKMGFVGRQEGIMALATASVVYGAKT